MSENFSVICRKIFRLFVDVGVYCQVSEPVHGIDEVDAGEAGKVLGTDIGFAEEAGDQQELSHGTVQQWSGRGEQSSGAVLAHNVGECGFGYNAGKSDSFRRSGKWVTVGVMLEATVEVTME